MIKVTEGSRDTKKIKANLKSQEKRDNKDMASKATLIYPSTSLKVILLKDNNQESIILT